ncbi:protease inhibitor I42 family protein [Pseudomonas stutzeri]|uniref:Peptidase inhibitor I42 n=1 Tax=Stutzerimonas stutzeri TaxID=316 RepID=A0A2N8S289_STUST|nr:protease inhibitor I42 family protein [Stutzerimonas stutzeri]MCQ4296296.1 protease inhibitor I42 family protein [Stutzerimonas stutzeri]PNF80735.1 peptidase inhibitor I42 [Stutzerimonas stutzeri]
MPFDIPRLLLAASVALLAACASYDNTPSSVVLSDDRRCPQTLQNGQLLIVSLPSNPATGYRWTLHESAKDQLRSLGPEVFSNPKDDMIGGDGLSTWRFQVQNSGSGRLYLTYQRPWESASEPADLFDCRIEVN